MWILLVSILIASVLSGFAAARRRSKRKWTGNMQIVPVANALALGTLADVTAVSGGITVAATEAFRALSVKLNWAVRDFPVGIGPVTVGICHSDYTVGEIKEFLEAAASMDRGNLIAREQASRLIRRVGMFNGLLTEETLNDGRPITTKLNWPMVTGDTVNAFAFNQAGVSLTGSAEVVTNGTVFIKWI